MHSYEGMRAKYSKRVSQTLDNPIMVFDYFELSDVMLSLVLVMFFGIVIYSFPLMLASLVVSLGIVPIVKRRFPKGIFFHLPYFKFGMSLPGILNPGKNRDYSD